MKFLAIAFLAVAAALPAGNSDNETEEIGTLSAKLKVDVSTGQETNTTPPALALDMKVQGSNNGSVTAGNERASSNLSFKLPGPPPKPESMNTGLNASLSVDGNGALNGNLDLNLPQDHSISKSISMGKDGMKISSKETGHTEKSVDISIGVSGQGN